MTDFPLPDGIAERVRTPTMTLLKSPVTPKFLSLTMTGIDAVKPHCFFGVQYFEDAAGLVPASGPPTAGIIRIRIQTVNSRPKSELPPLSAFLASIPATLTWDQNTEAIFVTPSAVSGNDIEFYQAVVSCNRT